MAPSPPEDAPTSYYNITSGETANEGADDHDDHDWGWDSSWGQGDRWQWGWHRPYGYRYHWPWGYGAEWNVGGGNFSNSTGAGVVADDDSGSGARSEDHPAHESAGNEGAALGYNRRASWNSSGAWTWDSSTQAPNSTGDRGSAQDSSAWKGSFGEKMAVPTYDAEGTGEEL